MTKKSTTDTELLARFMGFDIDPAGQPGAFQDRLAAEHGWTPSDAEAAIAEYRRFLYIAAISPTGATPSIKVDEVWHEHLLFTRNYQRMCQETVGRFMHHDPGTSDGDKDRYRDLYLETLARYEREFGETPPETYWPRPRSQSQQEAASRPQPSPWLGPISFGTGTSFSFVGIGMADTYSGLMVAIVVGLIGSFLAMALFSSSTPKPPKPAKAASTGRGTARGKETSSGGEAGYPVFAVGTCGGGGSEGASGGGSSGGSGGSSGGDGGSCGSGGGCGGGCGG